MYAPFIEDRDDAAKAKRSDVVQEAGLALSQYTIESHFCNPEGREQAVEAVKESVDAAVIFKTDIVRAVSGRGTKGSTMRWCCNRSLTG